MENDTTYDLVIEERTNAILNERERIIALLKEKAFPDPNEWVCESLDELIALIKGEN